MKKIICNKVSGVIALLLTTFNMAYGEQSSAEITRFSTFIFENDIFFHEDGGYTNGIAFGHGTGLFDKFDENNTWSLWLPIIRLSHIDNFKNRKYGRTHLYGQVMNTPEDISKAEIIKDQQPYSGMLLSRNNFYSSDGVITDRLGVYLGLVGPLSLAEQGQRIVHSITQGTDPQGWDNQLKNEPLLKLELARSRKLLQQPLAKSTVLELTSSAYAGVGNLSSDIGAGLGFRLGSNLTQIVNAAVGVPGREINPMAIAGNFNWYVFAEVLGKYVFNDIAMDGNSYQHSHSVELTHNQVQYSYGFAINFNRWSVGYTAARSSKLYETQTEAANFGAINISYLL